MPRRVNKVTTDLWEELERIEAIAAADNGVGENEDACFHWEA